MKEKVLLIFLKNAFIIIQKSCNFPYLKADRLTRRKEARIFSEESQEYQAINEPHFVLIFVDLHLKPEIFHLSLGKEDTLSNLLSK